MAKKIELDEDTTLYIHNDGYWALTGLNDPEVPVALSAEARERLLAALLMEEGS